MREPMYAIRGELKALLLMGALVLFVRRALTVYEHLREGDPDPLLAFPLTVIFPTLLILLLLRMPPTRSREGALMCIGTIVQLTLILLLPGLALYLALGMPVVFLAVELFETRMPRRIREPLVRMAVL